MTLSTPVAESRSWGLLAMAVGMAALHVQERQVLQRTDTRTSYSLKVGLLSGCSMEPRLPALLHFPSSGIMGGNYSAHLLLFLRILKFLSQCLTLALTGFEMVKSLLGPEAVTKS